MRRLIVAVLALSCARHRAGGPRTIEERYLRDAAFRRATLEASLVADNGYARLRRAELSTWEALPVYNPEPLPVSAAARRGDRTALRALGEQAFVRYPTQLAPLGAKEGAHGLTHLVPARLADGTTRLALTCASCHSDGATMGAPSRTIALGDLVVAEARDWPEARRAAFLAWGPGRLDVTTDQGTEIARIGDLRAVRFQKRLQHAGAVRHLDVAALAMRIETLIVGSHNHALRPPREVALGLAVYVESLADALPPRPTGEGARVFEDHCSKCHAGEGLSGDWVSVDEVGTDPTLARSADRGTGGYRIPSLRGVGTRGPLLHDGSVTLEQLLDPARTAGGHRFGHRLPAAARAALLAYLRAL